MKSQLSVLFVLAAGVLLTGCASYQLRLVQPASSAGVITRQPLKCELAPLDYEFTRREGGIVHLRIFNPTEDRIVLAGDRSFAVDPKGESHALRPGVLAPHSFAQLELPPEPLSAQMTWGPGWGGGFAGWGPWAGRVYSGYDPMFWDFTFIPPTTSYYQVHTPYDWTWRDGPVRLRLTYEQGGKEFEHNFEFLKERNR